MKKIVTAAALIAALSVPALAATDDELRQALVGTWGDAEGCKNGILVFNSDGTFTSGSAGDPTDVQKGTYTLVGGKLNGTAGDHAMPEVTVTLENGKVVFNGNSPDEIQVLIPCAK